MTGRACLGEKCGEWLGGHAGLGSERAGREQEATECARVSARAGVGVKTRVCAGQWERWGEGPWARVRGVAASGRALGAAGPPAGFCPRGAERRRAFRIERSPPPPGAGRGVGTGAPSPVRGAGKSAPLAGIGTGTDAPSAGRGERGGDRCSFGGKRDGDRCPLGGARGEGPGQGPPPREERQGQTCERPGRLCRTRRLEAVFPSRPME